MRRTIEARRSFFAFFSSGLYLSSRRKMLVAAHTTSQQAVSTSAGEDCSTEAPRRQPQRAASERSRAGSSAEGCGRASDSARSGAGRSPVLRSVVDENCAIDGGTFRRIFRTLRWRCRRM